MDENKMLMCLIAFILGYLVSRYMKGNGFRVGATGQCVDGAFDPQAISNAPPSPFGCISALQAQCGGPDYPNCKWYSDFSNCNWTQDFASQAACQPDGVGSGQ